jgi:hypothetical protein
VEFGQDCLGQAGALRVLDDLLGDRGQLGVGVL